MGSISLLQWRKSYMLEFLEGTELKECFTFSVPPESEEFQFPQRVSETKTFGGSVFDDYGNDTYRITLSGTTVNEDKKFIYKGKAGVPQYLTGTKEIFELQKLIKNWSDGKVSEGFFRKVSDKVMGSDRKVYLYDLSKMSVLQLATGVASHNYWRVIIKDLKIKRDKSKPKTYNYTLEMLAIEDDTKAAVGLFSNLSDTVDKIQGVMDKISTIMDITEATTAAVSEVADTCADVKRAFQMMSNEEHNAGSVSLLVGRGLDIASRIMGGGSTSFYNTTQDLLRGCTVFAGLAKDGSDSEQKGKVQSTNTYTVSFVSNGGSEIPTQKIEYSKTVDKPTDPILKDYAFGGWFSDSLLSTEYDFNTEVTGNMTLYAKWVLSTATITFNSRNGSQVASIKVDVGGIGIEPTPPTKAGNAFDKWYTDYDCTEEYDWSSVVYGNFTLYAGWITVFSIVFNSNGGNEVATQVVTTGSLAIYPKTPIKENYTFAYWCTDIELQNIYDFSKIVTADLTLYACWVQIYNTITFNSQGGSAIEKQKVVIGGYATKPSTNPTREGYDFVYWATDSVGTNEFRFNTTAINAGITLYAKWSEGICTVVFDSDGGSLIESQNVGYGKKAIFPEIPTKDGYSFEMWRTRNEVEVDSGDVDENDNPIMTTEYEYEEFDFSSSIKENTTLYALWFGE